MKYKTSEGLEFDDLSVAIRTELERINAELYDDDETMLVVGDIDRIVICGWSIGVEISWADEHALECTIYQVERILAIAALDAWYDLRGSDADATRWEACRAAVRGEVVTMEQLAIVLRLASEHEQ